MVVKNSLSFAVIIVIIRTRVFICWGDVNRKGSLYVRYCVSVEKEGTSESAG